MKRRKIVIVHYMPLEYYPPITNILNTIMQQNIGKLTILTFSCKNNRKRRNFECIRQEGSFNQLKIIRSPFPFSKDIRLIRLFKYLLFNLTALFRIILFNPEEIIYFESYSAFPVYFYSKYFKRKIPILIHYHEYESKLAYEKMMKTVQIYHQYEKTYIYKNAIWISQTNQDRLKLFHKDHPSIPKEVLRVMPNYPPKSWSVLKSNCETDTRNKPLRIVHVGSLSFHNTYIREFANWVLQQNNKVQFDVYSYNLDSDVKGFLKQHQGESINFIEEGIEYYQQPALLKNYDVAIILHKAHNENYRFNAPNKLFESLVCNLDVWYPQELEGITPYITQNSYPQVIPIDFSKLNEFNWKMALRQNTMAYKPFELYCEDVYEELVSEIVGGKG